MQKAASLSSRKRRLPNRRNRAARSELSVPTRAKKGKPALDSVAKVWNREPGLEGRRFRTLPSGKISKNWPIDGKFTVSFSRKGFFTRGVLLEEYSFDFSSQPFAANISESQFYQDPRDPNLKKLVATVAFSHPVDTAYFEPHVSLILAKDAAYLGLKPDSRNFTVVYDKFKLAAYIHSAALAMPRDDTPMTLHVDKGIRAARGGNGTKTRLESTVVIPGRSSLRFSGLQMTLVDNARYEPEQILMLTSSSPVAEKALAGKVNAWVLPVHSPKQRKEDTSAYVRAAHDVQGGAGGPARCPGRRPGRPGRRGGAPG